MNMLKEKVPLADLYQRRRFFSFLYLVFNSYRDQLKISNAEEQGISDHSYSVEAQHIEHGNHDLKGSEVHDELFYCWRISASSGIISYEFSNCCIKSLHF